MENKWFYIISLLILIIVFIDLNLYDLFSDIVGAWLFGLLGVLYIVVIYLIINENEKN